MPKKPNQLNNFQYFLRGADVAKSATLQPLLSGSDGAATPERKNKLIRAGSLQIAFALLTLSAMIGRLLEEPGRIRSNALGILVRSGIVLIDLTSGVLLLSDPDESTSYSVIGQGLMMFSISASRLAGEDGHHNEQELDGSEEEKNALLPITSQKYGSS